MRKVTWCWMESLMMQTPPLLNSYPHWQKWLIIIYKEIRFPDLPNSMSCFGWIWDLFAIQNTLSRVSNLPGERVSYHQIIAREKCQRILNPSCRRQTYYSLKHDALSIIISAKTMSYLMLVPHSLYAPILSNPKATPALSFAASNQMTASRRNIWQPVVQQN